ncbi:radical SAM protein, BA_1875 family [Archaeoglobus sulfaticallidus PM70-1]|uniref:Radical SAM protein, BA_1875 family n=1 Tax=Archaeoglobus sulfaticallidus PM70-1 TaxID=387631 RepID=N0BD19_9EURY|nr:TIGR04053 family radical SAM/SPASM domain-containing protein [Archaeoglobus sulfaticallidus]AGK60137.1 radical SAM protein, BA_1875 family [Archaeoglobus sulfaticallidus PM70-1]
MMFDIMEKPFIIFWELTRACKLACKHCRAKAQRKRHPDELNFEEVKKVIGQITEFSKPYPLVVITGGDPLMREDVFDIVREGVSKGLRIAIAFSGTDLADESTLEELKRAGVARVAISIDGSEKVHDSFRGIKGTFRMSMDILENARNISLSTQINTTVTNHNIMHLHEIARIAIENEVTLWDVFFVVPTGRARMEYLPTSQQFEDILNWLYDLSMLKNLNVKSSAATHLRRIEIQRKKGIKYVSDFYFRLLDELKSLPEMKDGGKIIGHSKSIAMDGIKRMMGITDGRGMFFISHIGEVYPSGFLPINAGNIREMSLKEIYCKSEIFTQLKNPDLLKGKCGRCEFRKICGGSRARAYAMSGDYLAEEPRCIYQPEH